MTPKSLTGNVNHGYITSFSPAGGSCLFRLDDNTTYVATSWSQNIRLRRAYHLGKQVVWLTDSSSNVLSLNTHEPPSRFDYALMMLQWVLQDLPLHISHPLQRARRILMSKAGMA